MKEDLEGWMQLAIEARRSVLEGNDRWRADHDDYE